MDNPHVSINELFARAQESFARYKSKERSNSNAPPRRRRKRPATTTPSTAKVSLAGSGAAPRPVTNPTSDEILWRARSKDDGGSVVEIEPSPPSIRDDGSRSKCSSQDARGASSKPAHQNGAYDALTTFLRDHSDPMKTSLAAASSSSIRDLSNEMKRREAAAASLRAHHSKLCARKSLDSFKPLSWDKPSFDLKPNADNDRGQKCSVGGSLSTPSWHPPKNQKECSGDVRMPAPRENGQPCYGHKRRWNEEDVASLAAFADKWFTQDMKRQKR